MATLSSSSPGDPGHVTADTPKPNFGQAALDWFQFSLSVIPLVPGKKVTAIKWDPWLDVLSPENIRAYWEEHPDHEVGCIVGDDLIVFDTDTLMASTALAQIEEAFDVNPALVVKTNQGLHHYFRRSPGTYAKSDAHSTEEHPERIDVKTGRAMVVLPPSTGKEIEILEVDHVSELPEVGQGFIDAVFRHNGRDVPRPPEPGSRPELVIEDLGDRCQELAALIAPLDPDIGYADWLHLGMAIYHETGGSDEGLQVFDEWSSGGKKYPGYSEIQKKWRTFRGYAGEPITVATINKLLTDQGYDWMDIVTEPFTVIETDEVPAPQVPTVAARAHPLSRFSLQGQLEELLREVREQIYLLGAIILMGQYSVIYAAPNTGKTLLVLYFLIETIRAGRIDPGNVYYINVDDDFPGLVEKLTLAEEYGFHMLAPGFKGFSESDLLAAVIELIDSDQAKETIIILDTLKKFTDLMNKSQSSSFNHVIRKFVMKGGTCVALAHVNKNRDASGKAVYAGTSDIIDDADCAYVLDIVSTDEQTQTRLVEFENRKRRGNVLNRSAYRYKVAGELEYRTLLASVEEVQDDDLAVVKQVETARSNQAVIEAITGCIGAGIITRMALAKEGAVRAGVSQRTLLEILDRYTGRNPSLHRWTCTVGPRGAKIYDVLPSQTNPTL